MDENRHIIRQIVRAILFLGKQGLPFRGDNEDLNITKNLGNFFALRVFLRVILFFLITSTKGQECHLYFPKISE